MTWQRPVYRDNPTDMNTRALELFAAIGRPNVTVVPYRDWGNLRHTRPGEWLMDDCGTTAGHTQHRRNGTDICAACAEQQARYQADKNAKRRGAA